MKYFPIFEQTFKINTMNKYIFLAVALLTLLFTSCRQNKELIYLQGLESIENHPLPASATKEYKLNKGDILYIRLYSMNQDISSLFNPGSSSIQNYSQFTQSNMYFQGYTISDSGSVSLPVLGDIYVENLTIEEAKQVITGAAREYIKDVTVVIKLANFKLTILGEINRPGMYYLYEKKVNLLDLIGLAGDLTDYGNRKNILVLRPGENGTVSYRVNLTQKELLDSELLYLEPNDLVYIEPLPSKGLRLIITDYGSILTAISSTLTAVALILTLAKP